MYSEVAAKLHAKNLGTIGWNEAHGYISEENKIVFYVERKKYPLVDSNEIYNFLVEYNISPADWLDLEFGVPYVR